MPRNPSSTQWLTLSHSAEMLGVHTSTLREWIDAGLVRAFRTPGGHRRVELDEIQRFLSLRQSTSTQPALADISERALVEIREGIADRRGVRAPWLDQLTKSQRTRQREIGHRLLGLLIQYAGRREDAEPILLQARELAAEYGRVAAQEHLTPTEVAQAFVFFRRAILESTFHPDNTPAQIDREGKQILQRINYFMDDLLLATLEEYGRRKKS